MRKLYTIHTDDGPQLIVDEKSARTIEGDVGRKNRHLIWIAPPLPREREVHRPGRYKINEVM